MKRFIIFFVILLSMFLFYKVKPQDVQEDKGRISREEIQERFSEQEPYFYPDIKDKTYEVVYDFDKDVFKYDLYYYETSRIISEEEHSKTPHAHTVHDLFFSFAKGSEIEEINLESVKQFHGMENNLDKKNIDQYITVYSDTLLEFNKNGYMIYWYGDLIDKNPYSIQLSEIENIIKFFKGEGIENVNIHVIELERKYDIRLFFKGIGVNYAVFFYSIKDNLDLNILKGIGKCIR